MPTWWSWKYTYAAVLFVVLTLSGVCGAVYFLFVHPLRYSSSVATASATWGALTLVLCLIFILGAAQTPIQFLIFFAAGAFGAGMGYLVSAWLTPNSASNPLDQARNVVAGVLTGVVGTKLLTLWDDLVNAPAPNVPPRILTPSYFVPIVLFLVGFTVSLSAFYTVRIAESGNVTITYPPQSDVLLIGPHHLGILPETVVQFAGAANSPVDVTVSWTFRLQQPCGPPINGATPPAKDTFAGLFDPVTTQVKAPKLKDLQDWITGCPGSQNWILTATSNQNHSKSSEYYIKFCRTKEDCPATPTGAEPQSGNKSTEHKTPAGAASKPSPAVAPPSSTQPQTPATSANPTNKSENTAPPK